MQTAPFEITAARLLGALRFSGRWLVVLLCLAIALPAMHLATSEKEDANRQSELTAPVLGAELLNSPIEPAGNGKLTAQRPESSTVGAPFPPVVQLEPIGSGFSRASSTLPWPVSSSPLFLPRPPPLS